MSTAERGGAPPRRESTAALLAAPAVLAALLAAAPLHADDTESASAFFRAGTAAFARKDYRAAALSFEAAFAAAPHGGARYNAGLAWESAGEPARAADAFAAALELGGLSVTSGADARDRLTRLQARLGRVQVIADGGRVTVGHVRGATTPTTIHLAPGRYALEVTFEGGELRTVEVEARAGVVERVGLRAPAPRDAGSAPARGPSGSANGSASTPAPDEEARGETQRLVGWIAVGAGAVGLGVGLGIGAAGVSTRDEYDDGGRIDADLRDSAVALRTWANVVLVSGAVLGATGVVLVLTAPSGEATRGARALPLAAVGGEARQRRRGVWLSAGATGASLAGRF